MTLQSNQAPMRDGYVAAWLGHYGYKNGEVNEYCYENYLFSPFVCLGKFC